MSRGELRQSDVLQSGKHVRRKRLLAAGGNPVPRSDLLRRPNVQHRSPDVQRRGRLLRTRRRPLHDGLPMHRRRLRHDVQRQHGLR
jgi:hypothetical protein